MMSLEDRRKRWRDYNRTEHGKARHRRYRHSARGKAKLREEYQKRIRFLDGLKHERGCLGCGETDPRTLAFYPRDFEKAKFSPTLVNITRSLKEWREVIQGCDVFCQNCSRKRKRSAKSRNPVKGQRPPQVGHRLTVNGCLRPDFEQNSTDGYHPTCETCKTEFRLPSQPELRFRKRFCSDHCRLLAWAARELLKAYQEGRADGLREIVTKLTEVKR